jgi:hypothetical protein
MHPVDLRQNLDRLGLSYTLGAPARPDDVTMAERRLGQPLPASVLRFYQAVNGLRVVSPAIVIEPLSRLATDGTGRVRFATLGAGHPLYLDAAAGDADWPIMAEDGRFVTRTLASFWSNTLWHWLRRERPIWTDWRIEEFGANADDVASSDR